MKRPHSQVAGSVQSHFVNITVDRLDGIRTRESAHEIVGAVLQLGPYFLDQVLNHGRLVEEKAAGGRIGQLRDDEAVAETFALSNLKFGLVPVVQVVDHVFDQAGFIEVVDAFGSGGHSHKIVQEGFGP